MKMIAGRGELNEYISLPSTVSMSPWFILNRCYKLFRYNGAQYLFGHNITIFSKVLM